MIKNFRLLALLLVLLIVGFGESNAKSNLRTDSSVSQQSALYSQLKAMDGVVAVQKMDVDKFKEKYKVVITQLIDPLKPERGTFTQRFFVFHNDASLPMVMVTEGYTAKYAERASYQDEISRNLGCNLVVVEHRYFAESTPDASWKYMTGFNAANDLHKINKGLRTIYSGKFITTGISKGGQTTMIYKTYFPEDADISVPYVGPVCFGTEDGRHEPFLANEVGSAQDRARLLEFQMEVLSRRDKMIPLLEQYVQEKGLVFETLTLDEVLDYSVLEYPFAFWQWGNPIESVPGKNATDKELFTEAITKSGGAEYFANMDDTAPFFVQAAQDLGYYGYDTKPFKGLLKIKNADNYLKNIFLPEDAKNTKFNHKLHKDIYKYLKENDPKMIFVYGQWDPWTAAAPEEYLFEGKSQMKMFVEPEGSHRARIGTLPKQMQDEIWNTIKGWLAQ